MKHRLIHTIAGGAAMLLLFGCQADEATFEGGSKAVNIQPVLQAKTGSANTRTTPEGQGFSDGDVIGVSLSKGVRVPEVAAANHAYTYAAGAWTKRSGELYWEDEAAKHSLRAYYPYDAVYDKAVESASFEMPVSADGTVIDFTQAGAWAATDKAWGVAETAPTKNVITIPMTHRMAQIIVKLKTTDTTIKLGEGTSVELLTPFAPGDGYARVGQFNVINGKVTIDENQPAALPQKLRMLAGSDNTFYAMVLPGQTFRASDPFARIIDANGKAYIYNLAMEDPKANLVATADEPVRFTLTLVKSLVSGIGVVAEAWGNPEEVNAEGESTEIKDTWLESLTKINCDEDHRLMDQLNALVEKGEVPTKLWITGTILEDTVLSYKDDYQQNLCKFIETHHVTDLCLDADFTNKDGQKNVLPRQIFRNLKEIETIRLTKATDVLTGQYGSQLFADCAKLKTVVLVNMGALHFNGFSGCIALENIIAPGTVTLDNNAFSWLKNNTVLKNIVLNKAAAMNGGAFATNQLLDEYIAKLSIFLVDGADFPTECKFGKKPVKEIHGGYGGSLKDYEAIILPENYDNHLFPAN